VYLVSPVAIIVGVSSKSVVVIIPLLLLVREITLNLVSTTNSFGLVGLTIGLTCPYSNVVAAAPVYIRFILTLCVFKIIIVVITRHTLFVAVMSTNGV
jgi:hypothetical protein